MESWRCFEFIANALNSSQVIIKRDCTVSLLFFSRHSDSSLLVGPYAWANHKNPISFSLRKWRGLLGIRYTLRIVLWDAQLSLIFLLPSARFLLTLLMTEIEARLEFCSAMKSHVSLPENEAGAVSRRTPLSLERLYSVSYKLLELTLLVSSSLLKHKVSEQYLTKQPRWSSDVIKACHQEILLLCATNTSFPLFSVYFSL